MPNRDEPQALASSDGAAEDRHPRLWVVLPAYNEEEALGPLLERIAASTVGLDYEVIVVDDGSRDRTAEIAAEAARRMPLRLERHAVNQGLGATIRDGLLEACRLARPEDAIITLDADNTQPPELFAAMLERLRGGDDVVVASRYRPGSRVVGVPLSRRAASYWGGWLFRILFPIRGVRDYTCGFRAYRAGALQKAIARHGDAFFDQDGFQCMVDILLKLRRESLRMSEVPLVLRYDRKEGASKMNVGQTARSTLALVLKRRLGVG